MADKMRTKKELEKKIANEKKAKAEEERANKAARIKVTAELVKGTSNLM